MGLVLAAFLTRRGLWAESVWGGGSRYGGGEGAKRRRDEERVGLSRGVGGASEFAQEKKAQGTKEERGSAAKGAASREAEEKRWGAAGVTHLAHLPAYIWRATQLQHSCNTAAAGVTHLAHLPAYIWASLLRGPPAAGKPLGLLRLFRQEVGGGENIQTKLRYTEGEQRSEELGGAWGQGGGGGSRSEGGGTGAWVGYAVSWLPFVAACHGASPKLTVSVDGLVSVSVGRVLVSSGEAREGGREALRLWREGGRLSYRCGEVLSLLALLVQKCKY